MLFIAPFAEEGASIRLTTPLESQSFVLMTLECLKMFGIEVKFATDLREFEIIKQTYKPTNFRVEGDWSSASYLLALGALSGEVAVENLNPESLQGDRMILDFLRDMGALVIVNKNSVTVRKSRLNGIKADLSDCIDLLPTMAVLAATADGVSQFTGIERARLKESDRVSAVRDGLETMGLKVIEEKNKLTVIGAEPKGSVIDARDEALFEVFILRCPYPYLVGGMDGIVVASNDGVCCCANDGDYDVGCTIPRVSSPGMARLRFVKAPVFLDALEHVSALLLQVGNHLLEDGAQLLPSIVVKLDLVSR